MNVGDIIQGMAEMMHDTGAADYIALHEGLYVASQIINILLGIIVIVILAGLPIIVALEVFYINIPTLQSALDMASTNHKSVEKILGLCLRDAKLAILKANTIETGNSVNGVYLGIKIKTIIIAVIIVAVLLGPFNMIIYWIIEQVARFLTV